MSSLGPSGSMVRCVPVEEIVPSDWIIPGPDMTLAEAQARLQPAAAKESPDATTK